MSGLLPDLASWALRGQQNNDDNNDGAEGAANDGAAVPPPLTPEEMRAQRLQRMQEQQEKQQAAAAAAAASATSSGGAEAMETEETPSPSKAAAAPAKKASPAPVAPPPSKKKEASPSSSPPPKESKKKRKAEATKEEAAKKLQRRKELVLRNVLNLSLVSSSTTGASASPPSKTSNANVVTLSMDSTEISVESIAEILATRLAMSASELPNNYGSSVQQQQKSLICYLGDCHNKASQELKTMRQAAATEKQKSSSSSAAALNQEIAAEITSILQEVQKQVVSYAATILMVPDLFELGKHGSMQLAACLLNSVSTTDVTSSITFGVSGNFASSFYASLVEELLQQEAVEVLESTVQEIVTFFCAQLTKCESVLDVATNLKPADSSDAPVMPDASPVLLVSALTALCMHKRVAQSVAQSSQFLLPRPGTPEASQVVTPANNNTSQNPLLQRLMGNMNPSFKKRSGPALDKNTVMGLCLRIGVPKNNAAFSPTAILRQSLSSIESATAQQRQQLLSHQTACNQLLHNLIKAGAVSRNAVLQWFTDAMLVNVGATATRPDPSKVSCNNLMLNMSVALLKLCDPFVNDASKHHLIDAGFVTSTAAHQGMFPLTGDDAIRPLGSPEDEASAASANGNSDAMDTYNPKNPFITSLFFLMARAINLGMASLLSQHENLLRHISHAHWMITSRNGDLHSDPNFSMLVSRQRSTEVALLEPDMVKDTLKFLNLLAKVLHTLPDEQLATMPEDFVRIVCDVIMSIAKLKPNLLRGLEFKDTFQMVVKLLSPNYGKMVRNPHLRAMLGDVLYELFLPSAKGDRREIPPSVYTDAAAGGQTYLLSDKAAQETLAPSLLLLYGEVERTGHYDKMSHRAKISSLIQYLWESTEHRPAFRRITQNKESFIQFANGIINETNTLIATVMQKLPEIRTAQLKMKNAQEWSQMTEEQQTQIAERLEDDQREVKHALPLCNKTLQMFGYLNTDEDIRQLFLLEELCPRLVTMLLHVLTKLVGSKGLELKVDNPEELDFKPKVMLQDLCKIFSLFASYETFQLECAKSGCEPGLLQAALKPVRRLGLLQGEQLAAFESLPDLVTAAVQRVSQDEALLADAPDEFLDEILSTFMKDPVILPSGHVVDRFTISQHLLNNPVDPFNREPLTMDDVKPATELKAKMKVWLEEKRAAAAAANSNNN